MSKSSKNKTMLYMGLGLVAVGAFFLFSRPYPKYSKAPPRPNTNNKRDWELWAAQVMALYGPIKDLWGPGGPFYKDPGADLGVVEDLLPNYNDYA